MSGPARLAFDEALPALGQALEVARAEAFLAPLLARAFGDGWRVEAVELVKHKPGRRCALVYTLARERQRRRVFAKLYKNERGATIFVNWTRFAEAVSREQLCIPQPLGYLPRLRMLVLEFLEGRPLANLLYAATTDGPARRMARALAALHGSGVVCARRWSPERELANTADWIRGLTGRAVPPSEAALRLLRQLEGWAQRLPPGQERPVHRDFYPEQVLDCEGRPAIVDLDDARTGDPALDVGNFLAHLTLRALQYPACAPGCRRAAGCFLEVYREACSDRLGEGFAERVRFYEASSLLRLSGVYGARERWARTLPEGLLAACAARLARPSDGG